MQIVIIVAGYLVMRDETSYLLVGLDLWVDEMDRPISKNLKNVYAFLGS